MSGNTLKFNNIRVINLDSVNVDQIVVSDKFKHSDDGFKYFIGYQEGETVKPLCIILPQMSGYIKYFESGGKNMSFLIKDDEVREKHEEIWKVIKNKVGVKFHSEPICEQKYLKAKVREYDGVIKTSFLCNGVPKEDIHYTCIARLTIDSFIKTNKKNYPQVYLEECKYKIKKIQMSRFINTELELDSDLDSNLEELTDSE